MIGSKVYSLDIIDSTNEFARALIGGTPEGTVVLARQQTCGRGRFGKTWYSPEQGLWMSIILRPRSRSLITIATGVAVCDALVRCGVFPSIKWPNDILLHGKKIGGILTEIVDSTVIVGIGLNLNIESFPVELCESASSVYLETKKVLKKETVYGDVCTQLDYYYTMLEQNRIQELLTKWRYFAAVLGQEVIIEMGDKHITGMALDISENGALIVNCGNGKTEHVIGGTCTLIKQNPGCQTKDA